MRMKPTEPVKPTSARAWTANDMLRATTKRLTSPATTATRTPATGRSGRTVAEEVDQLVDHAWCAPVAGWRGEVVRLVEVEAGAAGLAHDHDPAFRTRRTSTGASYSPDIVSLVRTSSVLPAAQRPSTTKTTRLA
jgi:hypothetical protein